MYRYLLLLHVLGATIWVGGHLFLAIRILPGALRTRSIAPILEFEKRFEILGMPALAAQVITGFWMASLLIPASMWLSLGNPISRMLLIKFGSLALTVALALDVRLRVLRHGGDDSKVGSMAWHIIAVTTLGILFVVAGVGIRTGGWS